MKHDLQMCDIGLSHVGQSDTTRYFHDGVIGGFQRHLHVGMDFAMQFLRTVITVPDQSKAPEWLA